jgi:rhamnose transport system ATP-binding protein
MGGYILELEKIVKTFPGVLALSGVNFQLKKGEIHALMGENGAGKSTFIKIITGVYQPDSGVIKINGEIVKFRSPFEAALRSIAAIYQHSTAYAHLTVAENIFIGHFKKKNKMLDWNYMYKKTTELLGELCVNIDPRTEMGNLAVAEQQIVEIVKAISTEAEIIIMDEPTAALSERECEQLYKIALSLRDRGVSIIFISHRLEDMYKLADRVTVLRDSKYIDTYDVKGLEREKLISAMVGREVVSLYPKRQVLIGDVVLEVENLSRKGFFENVSFSVRKGEILGLTGLVGAGRSEVCQAIYGALKPDRGQIKLEGKPIHFSHPVHAIKAGIGYLPEDRQIQGLILSWEIFRNQTLSHLQNYSTPLGLNEAKERLSAQRLNERLGTKIQTVSDRADSLSGGNQQKVIFSKLLDGSMKVLILDEPTKGVDVGAKVQIYQIIMELVESGYAIILISSEMPEVISISDRVAVMSAGRLVKTLDVKGITQEIILSYAIGSKHDKGKTIFSP